MLGDDLIAKRLDGFLVAEHIMVEGERIKLEGKRIGS